MGEGYSVNTKYRGCYEKRRRDRKSAAKAGIVSDDPVFFDLTALLIMAISPFSDAVDRVIIGHKLVSRWHHSALLLRVFLLCIPPLPIPSHPHPPDA